MDEQAIRRIINGYGCYAALTDAYVTRSGTTTKRMVAQRKSDHVKRTLGTPDALSVMSEEQLRQLLITKFEEKGRG